MMMNRLHALPTRSQVVLLVMVTLGLRLTLAGIFGAEVADISQYHWMADIVGRGENIYQTAGLFHYTPLPMFLPIWSLQLAETLGLPFHFVVKWPMLLADVGMAVLVWWLARQRGLPKLALWLGLGFALNPVSLLTTAFHGSYSVLPAFFSLLAYCLVSGLPVKRSYPLAALSLGLAIGLRGYPVLFVPFFLRKIELDRSRKAAFLVLAGLPSVLTILPFLLADVQAVWQGVFAYSGVTDYGWIASLRAYWLITTGNQYLPGTLSTDLLGVSKWLFLIAYALLVAFFWRKHERFSLLSGLLSTVLLFLGLYGGISSQYLVWAIPFALLVGTRWAAAYTWSATASLIAFYLFYFPAILFGQVPIVWAELNPAVAPFSLIFNTALWAICLAWPIRLFLRPSPAVVPIEPLPLAGPTLPQPPGETQNLTGHHLRRLRLAEAGLIGYVGLVLVLEINLLAPLSGSLALSPLPVSAQQPLQKLAVTTLWTIGQGNREPGEISSPLGLAVDPAGQIYLADRGNQRVAKFSSDGQTVATWLGDDANRAPFAEPSDIAIDPHSGQAWVIDANNGWIYRLDADGKLAAVINGADLQLYSPRGLAISSAGDIFVADTGGGRIVRLDQHGKVLAQWGQSGQRANQFRDPTGIVVQENDLFVADTNNNRIVHYTLDGQLVGAFATDEGSAWLAADGLGHIFVSSIHTQVIAVYDYTGTLISRLTPEKELPRIDGLTGIAATSDGHVYVVGTGRLAKVKIAWP